MDWLGIKNGVLLALIAENDFDVFITNDKNMYFQQNTADYRFSILNLNTKSNRYEDVMSIFEKIKITLTEIESNRLEMASLKGNYFVIPN